MKNDVLLELVPNDLKEPYNDLAEEIGLETTLEIINFFQGQQIYFPKIENIYNAKRDELIRKEFNGYNIKELSKKYQLSSRWIRDICKDLLEKNRKEGKKCY